MWQLSTVPDQSRRGWEDKELIASLHPNPPGIVETFVSTCLLAREPPRKGRGLGEIFMGIVKGKVPLTRRRQRFFCRLWRHVFSVADRTLYLVKYSALYLMYFKSLKTKRGGVPNELLGSQNAENEISKPWRDPKAQSKGI